MPEIGTSSSMSGDGKRSVGHRPQTTAPVLDSTFATNLTCPDEVRIRGRSRLDLFVASITARDP
jgi:hypothetical protein